MNRTEWRETQKRIKSLDLWCNGPNTVIAWPLQPICIRLMTRYEMVKELKVERLENYDVLVPTGAIKTKSVPKYIFPTIWKSKYVFSRWINRKTYTLFSMLNSLATSILQINFLQAQLAFAGNNQNPNLVQNAKIELQSISEGLRKGGKSAKLRKLQGILAVTE